jgi:hypothetical protein
MLGYRKASTDIELAQMNCVEDTAKLDTKVLLHHR